MGMGFEQIAKRERRQLVVSTSVLVVACSAGFSVATAQTPAEVEIREVGAGKVATRELEFRDVEVSEVEIRQLKTSKPEPQQGAVEALNGRDVEIREMQVTEIKSVRAEEIIGPDRSRAGVDNPIATDAGISGPASPGLPTLSFVAPVRENRFFLGEIDIEVAPDGSNLRVNAAQLALLFAGRIDEASASRVISRASADKLISMEDAEQAGITIEFDTASVEVNASLRATSRTVTELSLSGAEGVLQSGTIARTGREPAGISGYLTLDSFQTTSEDSNGNYSISNPRLKFDSAVHLATLGSITLEGSLSVSEDGDSSRGGIRAVVFDPDEQWAARIGDVGVTGIDFMKTSSILGIEWTNRGNFNSRLNTVRSLGERSFFLQRSSVARLIINGEETRRFELDPGPYNVRDFPLTDGANKVAFIIEDDSGEVDRIEFDVFADLSLLKPGQSEYGFSAGVTSGASDKTFSYDGETVVSGFYERGLSHSLSSRIGAQATAGAAVVVGGFQFASRLGQIESSAAASYIGSTGKTDLSARSSWRPGRRRLLLNDKRRGSLSFAASYQGRYYTSLLSEQQINDSAWRLNANWSKSINRSWSYSLGTSFDVNRDSENTHSVRASTSISHQRWQFSAQATYHDNVDDTEDRERWDASLSVIYDFDRSTRATYRTPDGSASLSFSKTSAHEGVGSWNYSAGVTVADDDSASLTGAAGYTANRFAVQVNQSANVRRLDNNSVNLRGSVRLGSAIAFADGQLAVGRPIRNSFLILYPHESLQGSVVQATAGDGRNRSVIASSGALGPALLPGLSNSGTSSIPYDVENLPPGYDLGSANANVSPGYRSGFAQQVGSGFTVTVIGKLVNEYDELLSTTPGVARLMDKANSPEVELFSNRSGRFGAQGLSAGRWLITMDTTPRSLTYTLDIPDDSVGLLRVGTLKPEETLE